MNKHFRSLILKYRAIDTKFRRTNFQRTRLVLHVTVPMLLFFTVAMFFYSRHETNTSLSDVKRDLTFFVVERAMELRSALADMESRSKIAIDVISLSGGHVTSYINRLVTDLPDVREMIVGYDPNFLADLNAGLYPNYKIEDEQEHILEPVPDYFCKVFLNEAGGQKNWERYSNVYRCQKWYLLGERLRKGAWGNPVTLLGTNSLGLIYSLPIFYGDRFAGVIGIGFGLDEIFSQKIGLNAVPNAGTSDSAICTSDGMILYHTNPSLKPGTLPLALVPPEREDELYPLLAQVTSKTTGLIEIKNMGAGVDRWLVHTPINEDLFIAVSFQEKAIHESIARKLTLFWLSGYVTILFAAIVMGRILLRIYNPIRRMALLSEEIAAGNLDVSVNKNDIRLKSDVGLLARNFNRMVRRLRTNIERAVEERARRVEYEGDLLIANKIQKSFLPHMKNFGEHTHFELGAIILPAHFVAGDFYDFWMISDDTVALLIGDVSGHSVPASLMMVAVRTLLHQNSIGETRIDRIIGETNSSIQATNDNFMFATLFFAFYNIKSAN